jgi:hypothetical protein
VPAVPLARAQAADAFVNCIKENYPVRLMSITPTVMRDALFEYLKSMGYAGAVPSDVIPGEKVTITVDDNMITGMKKGKIYIICEAQKHPYMKYINDSNQEIQILSYSEQGFETLEKFIGEFITSLLNPVTVKPTLSERVTMHNMKDPKQKIKKLVDDLNAKIDQISLQILNLKKHTKTILNNT